MMRGVSEESSFYHDADVTGCARRIATGLLIFYFDPLIRNNTDNTRQKFSTATAFFLLHRFFAPSCAFFSFRRRARRYHVAHFYRWTGAWLDGGLLNFFLFPLLPTTTVASLSVTNKNTPTFSPILV